jgi:hypothetical protein
MAAFIILDKALTEQERQKVENYLKKQFNLRLVPFETMDANGWFPEPDPETEG